MKSYRMLLMCAVVLCAGLLICAPSAHADAGLLGPITTVSNGVVQPGMFLVTPGTPLTAVNGLFPPASNLPLSDGLAFSMTNTLTDLGATLAGNTQFLTAIGPEGAGENVTEEIDFRFASGTSLDNITTQKTWLVEPGKPFIVGDGIATIPSGNQKGTIIPIGMVWGVRSDQIQISKNSESGGITDIGVTMNSDQDPGTEENVLGFLEDGTFQDVTAALFTQGGINLLAGSGHDALVLGASDVPVPPSALLLGSGLLGLVGIGWRRKRS
jgi:hypothetical protein